MSEKHASRWEKASARGKWFFVLKTAVSFIATVILLNALSHWLSDRAFRMETSFIVTLVVTALLVGIFSWQSNDGQYKNFLLDQKIKKGLGNSK